MDENRIEKIKITVLTPVHVGSGLKFRKGIEFFLKNDRYGVIDDKKILSIIGEDQIEVWITAIERGESILPNIERRKKNYQLEDISKRTYPVATHSNARDAREMMHTPFGEPIVPGSSLKGAIRTALWSTFVQTPILPSKIKRNNRGRVKYEDKRLSQSIFGHNFNKDILRFLQISDVFFQKDTSGRVEELNVLSFSNNGWKKKPMVEYAECLSPNSQSHFKIKISSRSMRENLNRNMILLHNRQNPLASVETLLGLCNGYYREMLKEELDFFKEDMALNNDSILYDYLEKVEELISISKSIEKGCILRLGHGTGYRFMTGNKISTIEDDREYYDLLREIRRDRRGRYDDYGFIKSRKMTGGGLPMGFVKLSIE